MGLFRLQFLLLLIAVVAWGMLLRRDLHLALPAQCGINLGNWLDWGADGVALLLVLNPPGEMLIGWGIMVLAMMAPMLAKPLHKSGAVDALSLVLIYASLWLLVGMVLMPLAIMLSLLPGPAWLYGAAMAGIWHMTVWKRRSLQRCHHGSGGAVGFTLGCIGACWGWMLLPLLVGAGVHVWAMMAATAIMILERFCFAPQRALPTTDQETVT